VVPVVVWRSFGGTVVVREPVEEHGGGQRAANCLAS
jgi:hypothetical protein